MRPDNGPWLGLAAVLLLLWFVTLAAVVDLQADFEHYKTMSDARYHALEDTPYPPPSYWEGLMHHES